MGLSDKEEVFRILDRIDILSYCGFDLERMLDELEQDYKEELENVYITKSMLKHYIRRRYRI